MPSRILIVRTSALGDIVHCLPVLTALRRHLPRATIGWVVEEVMAPLITGHPDLDLVVPARLRPWRHRPFATETRREILRFVTTLRRFEPDVVLDLMGNHKAGAIAALTGCRRRLGPARPFRRERSSALWINEGVEIRAAHAVDRALEVLRHLGLPEEAPEFSGEKLLTTLPDPIRSFLTADPNPYLLIQPGAGWGNKTYPPERWGEVASKLRAATGLGTLVAVAPGEEELAQRVVAASGGAARGIEAFDLATLAALLRGARLVLGGDTGPVHLAHALGVPVLCLMGPTDPRQHGPYGAPERALAVPQPCSFCYKRFEQTKACLLAISVEQTVERALELLS